MHWLTICEGLISNENFGTNGDKEIYNEKKVNFKFWISAFL